MKCFRELCEEEGFGEPWKEILWTLDMFSTGLTIVCLFCSLEMLGHHGKGSVET